MRRYVDIGTHWGAKMCKERPADSSGNRTRRTFLISATVAGLGLSGCLRLTGDDGTAGDSENTTTTDDGESTNGSGTSAKATPSTAFEIAWQDARYKMDAGSELQEYADTLYALSDGLVAASEDGTLARYTANGDRRWNASTDDEITTTYFASAGTSSGSRLCIPDQSLSIYAFGVESGERVWRTEPSQIAAAREDEQTRLLTGRAVVERIEDILVGVFGFSTRQQETDERTDSVRIEGYDPETGDRLWTIDPAEYTDRDVFWGGSRSEVAVLPNGRLAVDLANRIGSVGTQGQLQWEPLLEDQLFGIYNPGVTAGQNLYISQQEQLLKFDLQSETVAWTHEAFDTVTTPPVVRDGQVMFGSADNGLYAVDETSGERLWRFQTDAYIRAQPVVVNETAYVGSTDGSVYAVDVTDGAEQSSLELAGEVGALARTGATLYAGTDLGLYGLS